MVRLFVPIPEAPPSTVEVTGERCHYLARVLRLSPGARVEVFDGKGRAFPAQVLEVGPKRVLLELGRPEEGLARRSHVTLVQGLPKKDKWEWVLQKGTELGVAAFAPALTRRSVVRLGAGSAEGKLARWKKVTEEAARQCRRSDVPGMLPVRPLPDAIRALENGTCVLLLDEEEVARPLGEAVLGAPGPLERVALVVGPEGGFERAEVEEVVRLGGVPVSLGRRVLRTETAGLAALAVLLHLQGELG